MPTDYQYLQRALAVGSAKEAALYFDHVVPFDLVAGSTERENNHAIMVQSDPERIVKSLLPEVPDALSFYRGHAGVARSFWVLEHLRRVHEDEGSTESFFQLDKVYLDEARNVVSLSFKESLEDIAEGLDLGLASIPDYRKQCNHMLNTGLDSLGWGNYSVWHDQYYAMTSGQRSAQPDPKGEHIAVVLNNMELIDADGISWEQIIEIRSDEAAHKELRDMRLFLHKSVAGMEYAAAMDFIESRLERYDERVKLLGLESKKKSLALVVKNTSMALGAATALAGLLAGAPIVIGAGTAATLLAAVDKEAVIKLLGERFIQFKEAHIERRKLDVSSDAEVRYLHRLSQLK